MIEKLRNLDKKILAMVIFVIVIILILVFALIILSLTTKRKINTYGSIESTMVEAAKKYYKDNPSLLPTTAGKDVEIDATTLSSAGYMDDLSAYSNDADCTGKVIVRKTNDGHSYTANLNCGDKYHTPLMYQVLINKKVTSGDGLYAVEDFINTDFNLGVDEDGYDLSSNELLRGYIFRGSNVDNYVKIGKSYYRIIRIDGNNDIELMMVKYPSSSVFDNRYNSEIEKYNGINNYDISVINNYAKTYYRDQIESNNVIKTKGVSKNVCIGERGVDDTKNDGSIECSKVLKETYVSLLPAYEILSASLSDECTNTYDPNCGNYNYLTDMRPFWTLTPCDINSYSQFVMVNKSVLYATTSRNYGYGFVFYLSNSLLYVSGSGTYNDPYIVQ